VGRTFGMVRLGTHICIDLISCTPVQQFCSVLECQSHLDHNPSTGVRPLAGVENSAGGCVWGIGVLPAHVSFGARSQGREWVRKRGC
jgi:hypothetical protein